MREPSVRAFLAEVRERHPALQQPLTWTILRELLASDEHIVVMRHRHGPKARIRAMGDVAVISFRVKLAPREWLFAGAHEWAHWLLHGCHEAPTRGYVTRRHRSDDPIELEADFLARCLIAGPAVHVPWPEPAPAVAASPSRVPRHPPAFDPYTARPTATVLRREPRYGGRFGETHLDAVLRRRHRSSTPASAGVVTRVGDRVRFTDVDGYVWTVWDLCFRYAGAQQRRHIALPGEETARGRFFVAPSGAQRFYRFGRYERRDVAPKHLERQLRDAMQLPARRTSPRQQAAG